MKKHFFVFLFFTTSLVCFSQNNQLWQSYLSYNAISDLAESDNRIFAGTENAVFSKHLITNELKTFNSVNGLKAETITSVYHSQIFNKTLVGNENGLILVINGTDGTILNVIDILTKVPIAPNKKKINHFMEYQGKVYISCDFGIVVFDLATLEFGDTYFMGSGGAEIVVKQTAVYNGFIYAATINDGIRSASITNPNLNDFNQWQQVVGGSWLAVETFGAQLMALNLDRSLQKYSGAGFTQVTQFPQIGLDMRARGDNLVITTQNHLYVFSQALAQLVHINGIPGETLSFTSGTVLHNIIYIGTQEKGVVQTALLNPTTFNFFKPDGPVRNNIFSIQASPNTLWAVYGDYSQFYDPYPLDSYGVSRYATQTGWLNIPYEELLGAKSIVRIAINPLNEKQVYFSSYFSGLLKYTDGVFSLFNSDNSGLESLDPVNKDIRINGSAFDKTGNLWVTNSMIEKPLKVLRANNAIQTYPFTIIENPLAASYGRMVIDRNGTKWFASNSNGVIGFNENYNNRAKKITKGIDMGDLPSVDVRSLAVDNRNQLWIGTTSGLRVLPSIDSFISEDQLTANSIIIIDDGLAQELMFRQFITDICVDGSNNKWIGTGDSGVFMVSPNGQNTIYRFTKENSPLPSNVINDIDINPTTGEVFFATKSGMVSFKGLSTKPNDNLNDVYVYPNPVRPQYKGTVKISGLMNKATIKITDIEGNLVHEEVSEGGTIEWDTKAFGKHYVASGVYMIFISSQDAAETKVKKVMIIR